ncbi:hypothetical protein K438DRAFT_1966790 [Mycena galopus ATCC 62051]|nr:hypothetical protein K438DRAFT_1966790 [Mycena galopus ATCC 62051]
MTTPLTFTDKNFLETAVVGPEGAVHYTTTTTSGFLGRKVTTISSASGLGGCINWRDEAFAINGVVREWDSIKTHLGGLFSSEYQWKWGPRPFKLEFQDSHNEIIATPTVGNISDTVRFSAYHSHFLEDSERAVIHFPNHMQDEMEKMFLLMAILQTEIHRQDTVTRRRRAAA